MDNLELKAEDVEKILKEHEDFLVPGKQRI